MRTLRTICEPSLCAQSTEILLSIAPSRITASSSVTKMPAALDPSSLKAESETIGTIGNGNGHEMAVDDSSSRESPAPPNSTTSPTHPVDLRDISHYLPLYVIPLSNLENLASLQGRGPGEGDTAGGSGTASQETLEKQITVNIVVPQGANDENFPLPVRESVVHFVMWTFSG